MQTTNSCRVSGLSCACAENDFRREDIRNIAARQGRSAKVGETEGVKQEESVNWIERKERERERERDTEDERVSKGGHQ